MTAAFFATAALPAQIQFGLSGCYANGGTQPLAIAIGDNGEIAAAHDDYSSLTGVDTWARGSGPCPGYGPVGSPTFGAPVPVAGTQDVVDVEFADVDGVAPREVCALVQDPFTPYVEVFDGGPQRVNLPPGAVPLQLLAVDWDHDGDDDLLVLEAGAIHLGTNTAGTFAFASFTPPAIGAIPGAGALLHFEAGSFDNDDLPDLVVTWSTSGSGPGAGVLKNVALTPLAPIYQVPSTCSFPPIIVPGDVTVGDFDGNGVDDFAVLDLHKVPVAAVSVAYVCSVPRILPWPAVVAATPVTLTLPPASPVGPVAITSGDYDCDGDVDLAYTGRDSLLHVRPNAGNGTFPGTGADAEVTIPIGLSVSDLETADVDGDGDLDIVSCTNVIGGSCCVFCNATPAGRCVHEFRAGDRTDNYGGGTDCACPRGPLATAAAPLRVFDDPTGGALTFAHTFPDLPSHIRSATLTIVWRPIGTASDDLLKLDRDDAPGNFALDYLLDNSGPMVVLDLAHLPGGQNLLPRLEKIRRLDVVAALHTEIDSMRLDIVSCCPDAEPTIGYWHTDLRTGGTFTISIDAPPAFASGLGFIAFGGGVGCVHAPNPFQSLCLLPPWEPIFHVLLDGLGDGSITFTLPPPGTLPCCLYLHSQAMAIAPGFPTPYAFSPTITDYTK